MRGHLCYVNAPHVGLIKDGFAVSLLPDVCIPRLHFNARDENEIRVGINRCGQSPAATKNFDRSVRRPCDEAAPDVEPTNGWYYVNLSEGRSDFDLRKTIQ